MPLRDFTEAEIVLKARRRMEQPLLTMVWLGVVMFSLWQGNVWYLVAATCAVVINLLAVRHAKEVYVHRALVNTGVVIATSLLLVELGLRGGELLGKLGNYLVLIQLCKLFERKSNRDYVQMIALSLLLVISAALFCSAIWFAAMLVAYAALACYVGMVFTLKRNLDRAAVAKLVTESGPLSPHKVAWNVIRDWPTGALLRGTGVAMAVVLIMSVGLFLVSPRGPVADRIAAGGASVSGYSTSVELGRTSQVYQSDRVAMTVVPVRVGRAEGPLYLRGRAFRRYADSRWTEPAPMGVEGRDLSPPPSPLSDRATVLDCSMVAALLPSVFVPSGTCYVRSDQGRWSLDRDGTVELTHVHSLSHNLRYTTWSFPAPRGRSEQDHVSAVRAIRRPAPRHNARWVDLLYRFGPDGRSPAAALRPAPSRIAQSVRELARQWCADLLDPAPRADADPASRDDYNLALAHRIADRLRHRCRYTLDLSDSDPDRDGVVDFLFHSQRGHCEYFASAMTAMCQSLGVPARLATGFAVSGTLRQGERLYVRDRDAHAWTEIRTGQGWVIVDATPAASDTVDEGLWAGLRDEWERLGFLWGEYVLGYDNEMRQAIADWFAGTGQSLWSAVQRVGGQVGDGMITLFAEGYVNRVLARTALVVGAIALGGLALLLVRVWRRGRGHPAEQSAEHVHSMAFIQDLFDALVRFGLVAREHLTPRQLAQQAARQMHLPAPDLDGLVDLYYRLRWGGPAADPEEIARAEQTVRDIRERLERSAASAAPTPDHT